jgi:hypothetical protein
MANRRTRITFPVFNGYEVRVIQARDVAATGRRLREELIDAEAAFITKEEEGQYGIGWLVLGLNPKPEIVAHECSHAIAALLKYAGAVADEEVFAYHLGYLVGRVHKFLNRRKR